MNVNLSSSLYDVTASAKGFRYQERSALLKLIVAKYEEAAVGVEALDDVLLAANGTSILPMGSVQ